MDEDIFEVEASEEDAALAFMKTTPGEETPPEDDIEEEDSTDLEEETEEQDDEDEPSEEGDEDLDEDSEEGSEEEETPKAELANDDSEIEVVVDGVSKRVSVKDLKRLAGQEASMTQKSQSLSDQRKAVERQGEAAAILINKQYEKAQARAKQYENVDLFVASRELEPEEFDALRKEKQEAENDVRFFEQEAEGFLKASRDTQDILLREQAKESIKELSEKIPEWNDQLYADIRTYGVAQGFDQVAVNRMVDPAAIMMMHKSRLYDLAKEKAKSVTKKVTKAPKKVLKKSEEGSNSVTKRKSTAQRLAADTGDLDDVAAAFLAASK